MLEYTATRLIWSAQCIATVLALLYLVLAPSWGHALLAWLMSMGLILAWLAMRQAWDNVLEMTDLGDDDE